MVEKKIRLTIVFTILAALTIFGLFKVKYDVIQLEQESKIIKKNTIICKKDLQVLNAEKEYLESPQRLTKLIKKHLNFKPLQAKQNLTISGFEKMNSVKHR